MEQKIPNISDSDIERIVKRDFPKMETRIVMDILKMYDSESIQGKNRIYASILKLSNGNIEMIKSYVDKANYDFRDIITLAEYPNYSEHTFEDDLSFEKKKQLINDDWIQYKSWLNLDRSDMFND